MSDAARSVRAMTESQRRPVPFVDTSELDTALAFLRFARESVVKKLEGLDEAAARRELVSSGTNLLGLIRHLAMSEQFWFHHHVAGEPLTAPRDHTFFSMDVEPVRRVEDVVADYRAAAAHSDELVTAVGDPDTLTAEPVEADGGSERRRLRWVLAHMTSETARHAGHADILRELLDGTTGR